VVKRRTANRMVQGSNPGRGIKFFQVLNSGKRYRIACFSRYKTRHTADLGSTSGRYRGDIALLSKLNIAATSFHPKCDAWGRPFLKRSRKSCESLHLCSDVVEILLVDRDRKMACLIFIPSGFLVATNWNNGHSFSPGFHWDARCGFIIWRVLSLFFRQIRKPLIIWTTVTFLKDWLPFWYFFFFRAENEPNRK
jgi:hypothetical protein